MKLHMIGGWAYPADACGQLVDTLSKHADVVTHDFTFDPADLHETADPWWLCGWSLGGLKAMNAVLAGRVNPRGLILISSTARFCADGDYTFGVDRTALRSMIIGIKRDRNKTLQTFYGDVLFPDAVDTLTIEAYIGQVSHMDNVSLIKGLQELDTLDVRDQLDQLSLPTLLLHGEHDRIIPSGASNYIASKAGQSVMHLHPDAGHALPRSHPDWVADHLQSFITNT